MVVFACVRRGICLFLHVFGEAMASECRSPTSGDKGKKDEGRARVQVDGKCSACDGGENDERCN